MPRKFDALMRYVLVVVVTALVTLLVSSGVGATATATPSAEKLPSIPPIPQIPKLGGLSGLQVVWSSSSGREATANCPAGKVAIGGGVESFENPPKPGAGSSGPGEFPGTLQWDIKIGSSRPVGPGLPAPNTGFDFTSGSFPAPSGTAASATGWYGRVTDAYIGGARTFAVCVTP